MSDTLSMHNISYLKKRLKINADQLVYESDVIRSLNPDEREDILASVLKNICGIITQIREKQNDTSFSGGPYPSAYNGPLKWDASHNGRYTDTDQHEKNIAKGLFNLCSQKGYRGNWMRLHDIPNSGIRILTDIGKVVDYEIPLFRKGHRNIDLIAVKKGNGKKGVNDNLLIVELKKNTSDESLLRCVLEAYTYSALVDRRRLKESYNVSQEAQIFVCPLIFVKSAAYRDLVTMIKENNSKLKKIINTLEQMDGEIKMSIAIMDADRPPSFPQDCDDHKFKEEWLT